MIQEFDNAHEMLLAWLEQLNHYDPIGEQAAAAIRSLLAELDALRVEEDDAHAVLSRLSDILTRTIEVIKGPPP